MRFWELIQGGLDDGATLNRLPGAESRRFRWHRFRGMGMTFWDLIEGALAGRVTLRRLLGADSRRLP